MAVSNEELRTRLREQLGEGLDNEDQELLRLLEEAKGALFIYQMIERMKPSIRLALPYPDPVGQGAGSHATNANHLARKLGRLAVLGFVESWMVDTDGFVFERGATTHIHAGSPSVAVYRLKVKPEES